MTTFENFNLLPALIQALKHMHITSPTPIQAAAIPVALEGHDILATAQTGTGKTLAYVVPLLNGLVNTPHSTALIVAPTRELAAQVKQTIAGILGKWSSMKVALLIGGDSITRQLAQLRTSPRIIVGTPGRINDHLKQKSLRLDKTGFFIIDEADRMLDMGFGVQLDQIVKHLPSQRQTLMFSATLPPNIVKLSDKYLHQPQRISIGSTTQPISCIKQDVIRTQSSEKLNHLLKELNQREGSVIVFVKTKHGAARLSDKLNGQNQSSTAIHGDLSHRKRERVIQDFRDYKNRILVATDIAARGLDIPHIQHVINYDLPQCPEDYIHRIGRTARAGAEGSALCLISQEDDVKWRAICRLMNPGEANTNDQRRFQEKAPRGPKRDPQGQQRNRQRQAMPARKKR